MNYLQSVLEGGLTRTLPAPYLMRDEEGVTWKVQVIPFSEEYKARRRQEARRAREAEEARKERRLSSRLSVWFKGLFR